jgi:hypothetical protein
MTPAAFARDVAARVARIRDAYGYGDTDFVVDALAGLEHDALAIAETLEHEEAS